MSSNNRIKLVVAYDGTDFRGWAAQRGHRTVHGTLTESVRTISGEEIEITGASRTDSGAHARGQVCHFDSPAQIPPENWWRALNDRLPRDVAVVAARAAHPEFHSRFWADWRWYRYSLLVGGPDPLRERCAHRIGKELDLGAMQRAATALVGVHDFARFGQGLDPQANTIRQIFRVELSAARDEIRLDVRGSAFVRGMMRRITGALIEVGCGKRPESHIERLLKTKSAQPPPVAPACGLCLMRVSYGRHPTDKRIK